MVAFELKVLTVIMAFKIAACYKFSIRLGGSASRTIQFWMPWREVERELELHHLKRKHRLCTKYCSESVGKPGGEWRIVSMTHCWRGYWSFRHYNFAMSGAHSPQFIKGSGIPLHVFLTNSTTVLAATSMPVRWWNSSSCSTSRKAFKNWVR